MYVDDCWVGAVFLSDRDIRGLLERGELVVEPLHGDTVRENGLDLRLGSQACRLRDDAPPLDPEYPEDPWEYYKCFDTRGHPFLVNPGERVLVHTMEYVGLPSYVVGLANLRSTWARVGLSIPPTVVDAGFHGQIVIEIVGSSFPVWLRPGARFLHLVLARLQSPAQRPYQGDYQGQTGVRLPKIFDRVGARAGTPRRSGGPGGT